MFMQINLKGEKSITTTNSRITSIVDRHHNSMKHFLNAYNKTIREEGKTYDDLSKKDSKLNSIYTIN